MPVFEYPSSLVPQFPEDVYCRHGISGVQPQLMECLPVDKMVAIQFLKLSQVCLTFGNPATASNVLETGIMFQGALLHLSPADTRLRLVYLRVLPTEIDDDVISPSFSEYGEIWYVNHCFYMTSWMLAIPIEWLRCCYRNPFHALSG